MDQLVRYTLDDSRKDMKPIEDVSDVVHCITLQYPLTVILGMEEDCDTIVTATFNVGLHDDMSPDPGPVQLECSDLELFPEGVKGQIEALVRADILRRTQTENSDNVKLHWRIDGTAVTRVCPICAGTGSVAPRATSIYETLVASMLESKKLSRMSDGELAEVLVSQIWSDIPMTHIKSDIVSQAIDRLKRAGGGAFIEKEEDEEPS